MQEEEKSQSLDVLGIKPVGDAVNKLTSAAIDASTAFLSRICLPASEEFGLLLQDRVKSWRAANLVAIIQRAEAKLLQQTENTTMHAHPRIVSSILEEGSWIDDPVVQDMWAGLLSASCTEDGDDDSNLLVCNILADLTKLQARVLSFACSTSNKYVRGRTLYSNAVSISIDQLGERIGAFEFHRLNRELEHLRKCGLLSDESHVYSRREEPQPFVSLEPTPLALYVYTRCMGSRLLPQECFDPGYYVDVPTHAAPEIPRDEK